MAIMSFTQDIRDMWIRNRRVSSKQRLEMRGEEVDDELHAGAKRPMNKN